MYACHHAQPATDITQQDTLENTLSELNDTTHFKTFEEELIEKPIINYLEGNILFPNTAYRISVKNEIGEALSDGEWLEIYKEKSGYVVSKPEYNIHNEEEEPCSGLPTQSIETNRNSLLLFRIPFIKEGKLDSVKINNKTIEPNHSIHFSLNGQQYSLKARGVNPIEHDYRNKPNAFYELYLESGGFITPILYQTNYNDTFTQILFIGDLDQDGKPDIILSSPRDYEEERVLIYLSKENKHYEGTRQFDC